MKQNSASLLHFKINQFSDTNAFFVEDVKEDILEDILTLRIESLLCSSDQS